MEGRVVEGWRSRNQKERDQARSDVWNSASAVIYDEDHEPINSLGLRYGDKIKRHLIRFEDQFHSIQKLRDLRNRDRRIERAEWTQERRMLESERNRLQWLFMPKAEKKKRISAMVEYNKIYRVKNREKVNEWARNWADKNRTKINPLKRLRRLKRTAEQREKDNFQAAIYQQFLALAGLRSS